MATYMLSLYGQVFIEYWIYSERLLSAGSCKRLFSRGYTSLQKTTWLKSQIQYFFCWFMICSSLLLRV